MEDWGVQAGGLAALTLVLVGLIRALVSGTLVTGKSVDRLEARYQSEIGTWKEIADLRAAEADQLRSQLDRVLITADVTDKTMQTIREKALERDARHGENA